MILELVEWFAGNHANDPINQQNTRPTLYHITDMIDKGSSENSKSIPIPSTNSQLTVPDAPSKKKMGRRKKEVDIQQMTELAGRGFSDAEISAALGMSRETFIKRKDDNPDIDRELKKARIKVNSNVAGKVYELAMRGNPVMCIWWEKTRSGFSERQVLDVQTDQQFTLNIGQLRKVDVQATYKAVPLVSADTPALPSNDVEGPAND